MAAQNPQAVNPFILGEIAYSDLIINAGATILGQIIVLSSSEITLKAIGIALVIFGSIAAVATLINLIIAIASNNNKEKQIELFRENNPLWQSGGLVLATIITSLAIHSLFL